MPYLPQQRMLEYAMSAKRPSERFERHACPCSRNARDTKKAWCRQGEVRGGGGIEEARCSTSPGRRQQPVGSRPSGRSPGLGMSSFQRSPRRGRCCHNRPHKQRGEVRHRRWEGREVVFSEEGRQISHACVAHVPNKAGWEEGQIGECREHHAGEACAGRQVRSLPKAMCSC